MSNPHSGEASSSPANSQKWLWKPNRSPDWRAIAPALLQSAANAFHAATVVRPLMPAGLPSGGKYVIGLSGVTM